MEGPNFDRRLQRFAFEYFEPIWIGTNVRPPLYPMALWNVRDRTIQEEPRTKNNLGTSGIDSFYVDVPGAQSARY